MPRLKSVRFFLSSSRWSLMLLSLVAMATGMQHFVRQPSDQYVKLGQDVLLPCQVSEAAGRVQWTRDEFGLGVIRDLPSYPRYQMIGDDAEGIYSLEVQRVSLEDDAVFQCQVGAAVNHKGIRSKNARLTVLVPPLPPRIDAKLTEQSGSQHSLSNSVLKLVEGKLVQLECHSDAGKPPVEIEWYVDGEPLTVGRLTSRVSVLNDGKRTATTSSVKLPAARRLHGANLTCRVHNSALSAPQSVTVSVEVQHPPHVRLHVVPARPVETDAVSVTCHARAHPSKISVNWYLNGELMPSETSPTLQLKRVAAARPTRVTCQATNQIGQTNKTVNVHVTRPAWLVSEPVNVTARSGEPATLICNVTGHPTPSVSWRRVQCPHRRFNLCPGVVGRGSDLTVTTSSNTAGQYECRAASSHVASITRNVWLLLAPSGRVKAARGEVPVHIGTNNTLTCSVATENDAAGRFHWSFNGRRIDVDDVQYRIVETSSQSRLVSRLTVVDTQLPHLGNYVCAYSDSIGNDSVSIVLKQKGGVMTNVVISTLTSLSLVVCLALIAVICIKMKPFTSSCTKHHASQKLSETNDCATFRDQFCSPDMQQGRRNVASLQAGTEVIDPVFDKRLPYQHNWPADGVMKSEAFCNQHDIAYSSTSLQKQHSSAASFAAATLQDRSASIIPTVNQHEQEVFENDPTLYSAGTRKGMSEFWSTERRAVYANLHEDTLSAQPLRSSWIAADFPPPVLAQPRSSLSQWTANLYDCPGDVPITMRRCPQNIPTPHPVVQQSFRD